MQGRISRWGNSLALRLPKTLTSDVRLHEGSAVEVTVENNALVVRPARPRYRLTELLSMEEPTRNAEIDWGQAAGKEEW